MPPAPPAGLAPAAEARAVSRHTLALTDFSDCAVGKAKRVYCWDRALPPFVLDALPPDEGGAARVAISDRARDRVCVVSEAGRVFCNEGVHPQNTRLVRVNGIEKAVDISMDRERACVTTAEGRVLCWRHDDGRGETASAVDMGLTDAVEVSVWSTTTCALVKTGRVWCWGAQDEPRPQVLEPYTDVRRLGTGAKPCIVHADGRATCWDADRPAVVERGLTDAVAITKSKGDFSCALRKDGTVSCGGRNAFGYLGRGDWNDADHGKPVLGLTDVVEVETRNDEVCARRASGSIHCWGRVHHRDPKAPYFVATPTIVSGASPSEEVVCAGWHCCSRTRDAGLECWGEETIMVDASLRAPVDRPPDVPTLEVFIGEPEKMPVDDVVALGGSFVVTRPGKLHRIAPTTGLDHQRWSLKEAIGNIPPVARLLSDDPLCFEDEGGRMWCAGPASWRVPRRCNTAGAPWPPWDPRLGLKRGAMVKAGPDGGCATDGGAVRCWGEPGLGVDVPANASCDKPFVFTVPAVGAKPPYTRIARAGSSLCVIDSTGALFCAGRNDRGQLGRGTRSPSEPRLERVPNLEPVVDVAIAIAATCAVGRSGKVFCWGANDFGQLGDGTAGVSNVSRDPKWAESADRATAGEARGITNAKAITAGYGTFCALLADGKIACWGKNEHGEVGIGGRGRTYVPRPIEVVEPTEGRAVNASP